MRRRSSAIPHSLLVVDSSCGHNWCLCFCQMGQSWRMWWNRLFRFFAIAECSVHDANSLHVRSQATVSCSQPEYSGLLMSCQTVDWVSRGVVVSSGSFPLTSLVVSEQGFGFLASGGGHRLQLFAPRLSQAICSFISWNSTVGRDPL